MRQRVGYIDKPKDISNSKINDCLCLILQACLTNCSNHPLIMKKIVECHLHFIVNTMTSSNDNIRLYNKIPLSDDVEY